DVIELDVGLTADGVPVIHHEQRVDGHTVRDTDPATPGDEAYPYVGTPIRELSLAQVQTLDAGVVHPNFADTQTAEPGTGIPTLAQVAARAAELGWNGTFALEVKTDPSWSDSEVRQLVETSIATLRAHGVAFRVLGFDWRVLTHARRIAPEVDRVALVSARTAEQKWLGVDPGISAFARARMLWAQKSGSPRDPGGDLAAAAVAAGATMLSPERTMVTESLLAQSRAAGISVAVWTVNDPAEMHRLIEMGVDGIVTDFPDRLRDVMSHRGRRVPEAVGGPDDSSGPPIPDSDGPDTDGPAGGHRSEPEQTEPTAEEVARGALDKRAPGATPDRLLHTDYTDAATMDSARDRAAANARWWDTLSDPERVALIDLYPHRIGKADGLPAPARDEANRLAIAQDLADLRAIRETQLTDTQRQVLANLEATSTALADAERYAAEVGSDVPTPDVRVLSYDAAAFGGKGRAMLAFGDVDTADSVSWHVPGIKTNLGKLGWNAEFARNHYEVTARKNPGLRVASIAWLGYDAPAGYSTAFRTGPAEQGGEWLARDIAAANAAREARADGVRALPVNHVFGHSYGSTTTSYAGGGGRLASEVSTIT
ncbi:glycerophosphodiester phosphodiesterase family protein, partial [Nocardia aurea]|uniref:glycerophosphodiester phosphodiesterase family protein n=1 Tax=Nocardia aurea TaxID=2144174 RepID=UPI0033BE9F35